MTAQAGPRLERPAAALAEPLSRALRPAQKTQSQAIDKREFSNLGRHCPCRARCDDRSTPQACRSGGLHVRARHDEGDVCNASNDSHGLPASTAREGSASGHAGTACARSAPSSSHNTVLKPEFEYELLAMFVRNELSARVTLPAAGRDLLAGLDVLGTGDPGLGLACHRHLRQVLHDRGLPPVPGPAAHRGERRQVARANSSGSS